MTGNSASYSANKTFQLFTIALLGLSGDLYQLSIEREDIKNETDLRDESMAPNPFVLKKNLLEGGEVAMLEAHVMYHDDE